MTEEKTMNELDKVIQRMAHELIYLRKRAKSIDPEKNPRDYSILHSQLDGADHMMIAAIQTADGEHGGMEYYGDWVDRYLAETPDAIGLTDLASWTPRKGGTWRDYAPE